MGACIESEGPDKGTDRRVGIWQPLLLPVLLSYYLPHIIRGEIVLNNSTYCVTCRIVDDSALCNANYNGWT